MTTWDFKDQLKVGSRGEELFLEHYPRKLSIHPGFDGDFIVEATKEKLELKTDTYNIEKTENFFIERYSDISKKSPGGPWQAYEHGCNIFCYYFVRHDCWFEFRDLPTLLSRLEELTAKQGYVTIKNKAWYTAGYKIKRASLEDLYHVYEF